MPLWILLWKFLIIFPDYSKHAVRNVLIRIFTLGNSTSSITISADLPMHFYLEGMIISNYILQISNIKYSNIFYLQHFLFIPWFSNGRLFVAVEVLHYQQISLTCKVANLSSHPSTILIERYLTSLGEVYG